jgi:hypothetical protein
VNLILQDDMALKIELQTYTNSIVGMDGVNKRFELHFADLPALEHTPASFTRRDHECCFDVGSGINQYRI